MPFCTGCNANFEIAAADRVFYEKFAHAFKTISVSIPEPIQCPDCRRQRRLAFRNERKFYRRSCDFSGKQLISLHAPNSPYKVYSPEIWWGDAWDATAYGRDFDFGKTFFEQFRSLSEEVPKIAIMVDSRSENSDYSPYLIASKNCYLCIGGAFLEDCCYCTFVQYSKNCFDCAYSRKLELCYECVNCVESYNISYGQNVSNSFDSSFVFNCHGVKHCFCCAGLLNKEYHIFNDPYTPENYQRKVQALTSTYENLEDAKNNFALLKLQMVRHAYEGRNNQNVTGDYLNNSKSVRFSFDSQEIEDCAYVTNATKGRDNADIDYFVESELCFQGLSIPGCYGCLAGDFVWRCRDVCYSSYCFDSTNLLGCIGLRHKNLCILNKEYSEREYKEILPRIAEHMTQTGEFGQFFAPQLSPFSYNDTLAQEYYPLEKDEAVGKGYNWMTQPLKLSPKTHAIQGRLQREDLLDDLILQTQIICEVSGEPFKVIHQELAFYQQQHLYIPQRHPDQRHKDRMALRNPRRLWQRKCSKCKSSISTTYSHERLEIVICENCYREEFF